MRPHRVGAVPVVVAALAAGAVQLVPSPPRVAAAAAITVTRISGPSPFAPGGCGFDTVNLQAESDPMLAVDPTDARHLVASWVQDDTLSSLVAVSSDGGASWSTGTVPGVSRCTHGTRNWSQDPSVAIGPDGIVYLATRAAGTDVPKPIGTDPFDSQVLVNASRDGGRTWRAPVVVAQDRDVLYDEFTVAAADPTAPGRAYVSWKRAIGVSIGAGLYVSHTGDGGDSWSPGGLAYLLPPGRNVGHNQLLVSRDGALVDVFQEISTQPGALVSVVGTGPPMWMGGTTLMAMRSTDHGQTWSTPVQIATVPPSTITDPDGGRLAGAGYPFVNPSAALGPDGAPYVAWYQIDPASSSRVLFSTSPDHGATWATPKVVAAEAAQAFMPQIAVTADGVIGVSFYDFRHDVRGDNVLTTDFWLRQSHDGGVTWQEDHVAGAFDLRKIPSLTGFPMGLRYSLVALPEGLATTFIAGAPFAAAGPTDVFFAGVDTRDSARLGSTDLQGLPNTFGTVPRGQADRTLGLLGIFIVVGSGVRVVRLRSLRH